VVGFTRLQAPLVASFVVLSMTGFVVTGTIDAENVDPTVKAHETKACVDALMAQTETLLELGTLAADANRQVGHLRERAREIADSQHKKLDEAAFRAQSETSSQAVRDELAAARQRVFGAADVSKCQDPGPNTIVAIDLANLGRTYNGIVRDFGREANDLLDEAQDAFDELAANVPTKPAPKGK
jgi:hypothetical protein